MSPTAHARSQSLSGRRLYRQPLSRNAGSRGLQRRCMCAHGIRIYQTMIDLDRYEPRADLLAGRVILVTGASRGIGRVAALTFASYGATVILHGRDVARLEAVYDEIEAAENAQATILPLALEKASDRDFENMAQAIQAQLKRLDGILHNASHFTHLGPLEHEHHEDWSQMLRVNLIAPFALTRACTPL